MLVGTGWLAGCEEGWSDGLQVVFDVKTSLDQHRAVYRSAYYTCDRAPMAMALYSQ